MRRLDRGAAICFVPVAEAGAACPIEPSALLAAFHAEEDGRIVKGAAAFAAMWRAIPLLRPLGLAARSPLVLKLLEVLYQAFLRLRPSLQDVVRRLEGGGRLA